MTGDGTVEPAHAHGVVGHAQAHVGRAERFAGIAGLPASEVHEALEAEADLPQVGTEQLVDQPWLEVVAAGRDRGVGGEDETGPGDQAGLFEGHLTALAQLSHALDGEQEAVALVHVEDGGLDAHGPQRPHAADPEHDLLAQPPGGLGDVEAVGDRPQLGRVGLQVGVQQEEGDPTHLGAPDPDP